MPRGKLPPHRNRVLGMKLNCIQFWKSGKYRVSIRFHYSQVHLIHFSNICWGPIYGLNRYVWKLLGFHWNTWNHKEWAISIMVIDLWNGIDDLISIPICVSLHVNALGKRTNLSTLFPVIIRQVKLVTLVEGNPKAPFSIAPIPRCRGGRYSIPWIAPLYPWSLPYNAKC